MNGSRRADRSLGSQGIRRASIEAFTLAGGRVKDITAFASPALLPYFNLPDQLG